MKDYQNPEMEILLFEEEDIITTSSFGMLDDVDHSGSTDWNSGWEI